VRRAALARGSPGGYSMLWCGVFTEGVIMAEQQSRGHFWIYVWLGVSMLLNLSGMASIIDGFVTWTNFFGNFIDVYRAVIRQPLAWVGQFIWLGPIPGWVFDVYVICAALFLAFNIVWYRETGKTYFAALHDTFLQQGLGKVKFWTLGLTAFLVIPVVTPLVLLVIASGLFASMEEKSESRQFVKAVLLNFLLLLATFTLLLFINWQIRQHGG
jgi:hypothetical protein